MAKVIVVINQKGGVAKTTTSLELAYNLKKLGYEVLAVDVDPSANLSNAFNGKGIPFKKQVGDKKVLCTVADLLLNPELIDTSADRYQGPVYQVNCGIDLVPAPPDELLAGIEPELNQQFARESNLRDGIERILERTHYDFVIIDTPPSLGVFSINALTAADELLIPCVAEDFSASGVVQLNITFKAVQKKLNRKLKYNGMLFTRIQNTNEHKKYIEMLEGAAGMLGIPVYQTQIPATIKVPASQRKSMPLSEFNPKASAAMAYEQFTNEFLGGLNHV